MLYGIICKVLAAFVIMRPLDEAGNEYDPPVDSTPGNVSFPVPFSCRYVPRDQRAIDLIYSDTAELVPADGIPEDLEIDITSLSEAVDGTF